MEKEVKTIGQEVTKAVETMKEAGKQGKQPQQQPEKEEKPDTPKSKGKNPKKDEAAKLQEEINRKTKELEKCLAELERKKEISRNRTVNSSWISWMKRQESCKRTTLLKRPSINCDLRTLRAMAVIATSLPFLTVICWPSS